MDSSEPRPEPSPRARYGGAAKLAALVLAALLVGGGVVYAVDRNTGSAASADSSGAFDVDDPADGPGGLLAGEQHIHGTVGAKTSTSVTVKSSSGTATYTVTSTTQIVRNGRSATMSQVQVGDPVLVHVYPSSSGEMLVERLLAGSSATDLGPRPPSSGSGGATTQGGVSIN